MGSESDEEISAAVREVEEAAKTPQKKAKSTARKTKPTADKSQTEHKRNKLIELSRDGVIDKTAGFIRKSNKDVVDRLYRSFNAVESSEKLSEELLSDKLLKDDVCYLTRMISPNIPFIGLISGGCTTAKHVVAYKWNKKEKTEEISEEAKQILLHSEEECQTMSGRTPGKELNLKT
ncbi:Hypothetical predicted protein [Paramuricea clavata]|uniref:Uncharacterized protein n=1 Tax=Paramuricea clavata TaxID=317549 RepID=A0A7D9EK28_PARCT|nr:Hypothetical predicted protein [Paramuricea clavata]